MCGRFNVMLTPGLEALLASLGQDPAALREQVNVAPTETVQLLKNGELREARWWLTPHWARAPEQKYAMFNARSERLAESPAFRGPFRSQRGLLPMSSFIEWRGSAGSKQPWLISNPRQALAAAALWDLWHGPDGDLLSCTIITTDAAPSFRPWHSRMPVFLEGDEIARWLDNERTLPGDDPIFASRLKTPLELVALDRAIGNSHNKDPALLSPAGEIVRLRGD
jgi:putative SOS response-associated peptidase YedK